MQYVIIILMHALAGAGKLHSNSGRVKTAGALAGLRPLSYIIRNNPIGSGKVAAMLLVSACMQMHTCVFCKRHALDYTDCACAVTC